MKVITLTLTEEQDTALNEAFALVTNYQEQIQDGYEEVDGETVPVMIDNPITKAENTKIQILNHLKNIAAKAQQIALQQQLEAVPDIEIGWEVSEE